MSLFCLYLACVFPTNKELFFVEEQMELNQIENNTIKIQSLYISLSSVYNLIAFIKIRRKELLNENSTLTIYSNGSDHPALIDAAYKARFEELGRKIEVENHYFKTQRLLLNNKLNEAYRVCINIMEILNVLLKKNGHNSSSKLIVESLV